MAKESKWRQPTPEVEEILREHLNWLRRGKGRQADFSNREDLQQTNFAGRDLRRAIFRKANLQGANLQGADLHEANLQGAGLQDANLHQANLRGAELQGADLHEAVLSQTSLQNVDLTAVKNLFVSNLGGADLTGAKVPQEIQDFLDKPGNLDEVARLAGSLFVTVLTTCAYIGLTVLSTSDAGLLTNMATSRLPILSIDIPIAWFYWLAPFLLLSMYMYFHLTLQRFWDGLAGLPAIYADGMRLDQRSYPWLLNALVGKYVPVLKEQEKQDREQKNPRQLTFSRLQVLISIFFAWWLVPLMIGVMWFRYLTRHDWTWTGVQMALLGAAVWFGFISWRVVKSTLQGQGGFFLALWRNLFSGVMALLLLIITGLTLINSYGVIEGISADQDTDESRISDERRTKVVSKSATMVDLTMRLWAYFEQPQNFAAYQEAFLSILS